MYDMLKGFCGESQRPLSTLEKVLCAAVAGATGAFAGNPGDLAMVRMQVWPFSSMRLKWASDSLVLVRLMESCPWSNVRCLKSFGHAPFSGLYIAGMIDGVVL